jgi:hypothetical protein
LAIAGIAIAVICGVYFRGINRRYAAISGKEPH